MEDEEEFSSSEQSSDEEIAAAADDGDGGGEQEAMKKEARLINRESEKLYKMLKDGSSFESIKMLVSSNQRLLTLQPRHVLSLLSTAKRTEQGKAAIFEYLGQIPSLWTNMPGDFYVVHMCAEFDMPQVTELFFRHKLDPLMEQDASGETILHVACRNDCIKTLKWLSEIPGFVEASRVRNFSGALCFDLTLLTSEARLLFQEDYYLPRVVGATTLMMDAKRVVQQTESEGLIAGLAAGKFRRAVVGASGDVSFAQVLQECNEAFTNNVLVIDVLAADNTIVSLQQQERIEFKQRAREEWRVLNNGTWQDEFYKFQVGRMGFRQLVIKQLIPALRASHPTGMVLLHLGELDYVQREDLQLLALEVAHICELCCEGRFVTVFSSQQQRHGKAYIEALCGDETGAHEDEDEDELTKSFYLEEKVRKSKRGSSTSAAAAAAAARQAQNALPPSKARKRKMDDTLAFDFVKRIKQQNQDPALFQRFVDLLTQYQSSGNSESAAEEALKLARELFADRRDLLDAFNSLVPAGALSTLS